jgi:carboxyl-terminal processing protease
MLKKRSITIISILSVLILVSAFSVDQRFFEIARSMSIFSSLYKEVNTFYVDEVNPNKIMNTGIDAMLKSLDPYTNYIPEDRVEDYRTMNTGQYGGIGASTIRLDGNIFISMLFEGYPAQNSGLKIGDQVLEINGIEISDLSGDQISQLMKGQSETDVILTVKRYGENNNRNITVERTRVTIKNVPYFGMIDENTGFIKLTEFTQYASANVKEALIELKKKGAQSIILDLRGNPGGLLVEAVNLSNIFIPKGKDVVFTKGKLEENNMEYRAMFDPVDTSIPLVVLINSGSASASEIVAGVIQDYDRGVLIGHKSYGKGLVQTSRRLSYNSQIKITTAKYYIPSGRCIQAIDYSNRREDGSVGKVADSLISEFKTSNGRKVLDGGGIDPDIKVEETPLPPVASSLISKGYIFKYANIFSFENDSIAKPGEFHLSETDYKKFISWLKNQDFEYRTMAEQDLEKLKTSATKEKRWREIEKEYNILKERINQQKEFDLIKHKPIIKSLLEEEIVSRYYLQSGAIEAGFRGDPFILKAMEVLDNTVKYNKILNF